MNKLPHLSLTLFLTCATALSAVASEAFIPDDPLYPKQWQWNPDRYGINITGAWEMGYTGEGVVIGIIDQWVDPLHPDLAGNYSSELSKNFATEDTGVPKYDGLGHGTFVAGMAAAVGGNGIGVTGAAPRATLAGLHIGLDGRFDGTQMGTWISQAYLSGSGIKEDGSFLSDAAIHIKNCSFGPQVSAYLFKSSNADITTIKRSSLNNVIYVYAAGNDRTATTQTPADTNAGTEQSIEDVIVVAATNSRGNYAVFSNYGSNVFVSAPGQNVVSTTRGELPQEAEDPDDPAEETSLGNHYGVNSGTSFSAPTVSGVLALAAQGNIGMDSRWAKHALARTSENPFNSERLKNKMADSTTGQWVANSAGLYFNNDYGFGLLDADKITVFADAIAYETVRTTTTKDATIKSGKWDKTAPVIGIVSVSGADLNQNIESIELTIDIQEINFYRDAKISIVSPSGTRSVVLDTSTLTADAAAAMWQQVTATELLGETGKLNWTFVTNAFWGALAEKEVGEWKVEFENKGTAEAKVNSASLKFNLGDISMESADMRVKAAERLNVHTVALDKADTSFTVEKLGTLSVEDSLIVNNGTLVVEGNIDSYVANWDKGVKVHQNGGAIRLATGGTLSAKRGIDVSGGNFVFAGGNLSGDADLTIQGGNVLVEKSSSTSLRINLKSGNLDTSRLAGTSESFSASGVAISGGEFIVGGTNRMAVTATGGLVTIVKTGVTKIDNLGISADAATKTAGTLNVPQGATLALDGTNSLRLSGVNEPEKIDAVTSAVTPAIFIRSYAAVGGVVASGVEMQNSLLRITSPNAKFEGIINVGKGATFDITTDVDINSKITGGIDRKGLTISDGGEVIAGDKATIKTQVVEVKQNGVLYIGGTGVGSTTINATSSQALSVAGGTLKVAVGDKLYVNGDVKFDQVKSDSPKFEDKSKIELSFLDSLPDDEIEFIQLTDGKTLTVVEDSTALILTGDVPTIWDGKKEIEMAKTADENPDLCYYKLLSDGTIKLQWPDGSNPDNLLELLPLRMTYSSMTAQQLTVAKALRTCLPEGPNGTAANGAKALSQDLIAELNKSDSVSALQSAYDQFLPTNLISINDLHNKQATAITRTIDRRSTELRNGAPTADLWSTPLFNAYGFSYSANPNAIAATGFREFAGYDYEESAIMVWANGGYSFSDNDANGSLSETKNTMTNASIGFDFTLNEFATVGLSLNYSSGTTEVEKLGTKSDASLRGVSLYLMGSKNDEIGSLYYTAMASYGFTSYDLKREVKIGTFSDTASGSPDGSQILGYLAAGYEWSAGSRASGRQWTTGPSISVRYTRNSIDSYQESGNGINSLSVEEFEYDSLVGSIGWRSSVRCDIKDTISLVPELRLAWQREFLDSTENINASFTFADDTQFASAMNRAGKDYATIGLGVSVLVAESLTVSLDYDVNLFREDADPEHSINLMVRCRF